MSKEDFVALLQAKNHTELDLARELLTGAEIPFIVDASDRFEMLEVLEGQSAEGIQVIAVPKDRLDDAASLLEDAWGPEAFAGRDPRK